MVKKVHFVFYTYILPQLKKTSVYYMETLMITTICITLFWHRFLKKKRGGQWATPQSTFVQVRKGIFSSDTLLDIIWQTPSARKWLSCRNKSTRISAVRVPPWNCAPCYTESFKESPTKSSTECKGSGLPTSETLCKESTVWVVAFGNFRRWVNTSNVWCGEFGLYRLQWLKMLSHEHE